MKPMDGIGAAHRTAGQILQGHIASSIVPEWFGVVGAAIFVMIAASHLRYLRLTSGQRRPWHACHVLIAAGMAFMYAPHAIDPLSVPPGFWKLVFAMAGVLTAFWAVSGVGRVATVMWLLTALDLAVMLYMWSGTEQAGSAPIRGLIVVYLVAEAGAWALDAYRQIDGDGPLISWRTLSGDPGGGPAQITVPATAVGTGSLLGQLDIGISMVAMALGMAYMVAAMQLMS
jgi:hypothetical protein